MMEKTISEENEAARTRQLTRTRDRARIFREVLANPRGKLVLEALLDKFGHALPPNVLDSNGRTDEYQTWRRLGHFDVMEFIQTQLEYQDVNPSLSGS
jgi:hypothetical protein